MESCKVCFVVSILLCLVVLRCASPAAGAAPHLPIARVSILGSSFACSRQLCFDKLTSVLQMELPKQRICSGLFQLNPASLHSTPLLPGRPPPHINYRADWLLGSENILWRCYTLISLRAGCPWWVDALSACCLLVFGAAHLLCSCC